MFKKQAISALVTGSVLALTMLGAASSVHAAALTPTQVSAVVTLLQSFGVDAATVANVQAVLNGTSADSNTRPTVSATATSVTGKPPPPPQGQGVGLPCAPGLAANLHVGSEGDDVSNLQSFLSKDPSIFPQGQVTGFFGPKTREAVRHWQIAHGIVATDTPAASGAGLVGPTTRGAIVREMEQECHDQKVGNSGSTTPRTNSGDN